MIDSPATRTRLAVIIPVLHDATGLTDIMTDLAAQSRKPDEIIVVSGAHDAAVAECAARSGARLLDSAAARGLQLDIGARAAHADILWFVHADARVPRDACQTIIDAMHTGAAGGCLRFVFAGSRSVGKRLLECLVSVRIACGGIAYGDQALFCTSAAYLASGGFPHAALFEEVRLVRFLQRRHRFVMLETPVVVSCRRWERDGWVRRSLHNRWLAVRHALGATPESLAKSYRARSPRGEQPANEHGATETRG